MDKTSSNIIQAIETNQAVLGVEFGSTRIKAVLIVDSKPIASGEHGWENVLEDGIWTYSLDDVWTGLQASYSDLCSKVQSEYGVTLKRVKAIGVSGMMHGHLALDASGNQLAQFRTWRNNMTGVAAAELTELFQYPIPQRWSIAHLYQAILNGESHVGDIAHITTLAGYVHWKLTGRKVMGIGEASGMFPIDLDGKCFDDAMIERFDEKVSDQGFSWKLSELLPEVLEAGLAAGELSEEGARLLDPSGTLEAGIPLCPPEGDACTGMVATNSVEVRTGNVSAGTSVFAMLVLEKGLSKLQPEIDLVTTPEGKQVAMVHSNNCTSDIDAWVQLLGEAARALGAEFTTNDLFGRLLPLALEGEADCGGLLAYGYVSGEHMTGLSEGRPLFVRSSNSQFTLANFMRTHLMTALCAMRIGLNILVDEEGVELDEIRGHGGFFKTPGVGQRIMAAATKTPVSVLETAGEGGAWGIALLAAFMMDRADGQSLPEYLNPIFSDSMGEPLEADAEDVAGFEQFLKRYQAGLPIERAAVDSLD